MPTTLTRKRKRPTKKQISGIIKAAKQKAKQKKEISKSQDKSLFAKSKEISKQIENEAGSSWHVTASAAPTRALELWVSHQPPRRVHVRPVAL